MDSIVFGSELQFERGGLGAHGVNFSFESAEFKLQLPNGLLQSLNLISFHPEGCLQLFVVKLHVLANFRLLGFLANITGP